MSQEQFGGVNQQMFTECLDQRLAHTHSVNTSCFSLASPCPPLQNANGGREKRSPLWVGGVPFGSTYPVLSSSGSHQKWDSNGTSPVLLNWVCARVVEGTGKRR